MASKEERVIHKLKIEQVYLDALISGEKSFEVRLNDRGYQKGDILQFHNCANEQFEITYIHSGLGLQANYVVLAVARITEIEGEK